MRLDGLERHREGSGPLQRLDARLKLIAALALILVAGRHAGRRLATRMAAVGLLLAFVIGLSGVPPRELWRRWLGLFLPWSPSWSP